MSKLKTRNTKKTNEKSVTGADDEMNKIAISLHNHDYYYIISLNVSNKNIKSRLKACTSYCMNMVNVV